jgi:hypothetical protein
MKKYSLVFSILFLFFGTTFAFNDVQTTHKNNQAIEYLKNKQVIQGYADGTFKPEKEINRAEMIKILVEGKGIKPDSNTFQNCFPDVGEEWFAPYVCYAKFKQWIGGYPDGTFKPSQTVSKVESLKMILNAFGVPLSTVAGSTFSDVNVGDWFAPYVRTAKEKGLLEESSITFNPAMSQSRARVSENLFRTMVVKEKKAEVFAPELLEEIKEIVKEEVASVIDEKMEEVETELAQSPPPTQECPIVNGKGLKTWESSTWGQCEVATCNNGYEAKNNTCILKTEVCIIENGTGTREWNTSSNSWESCELSCNDLYHSEESICVPNKRNCTLQNGTGIQEWSDGIWGQCLIVNCEEGFVSKDGVCDKTCTNSEHKEWGNCNPLTHGTNCYNQITTKEKQEVPRCVQNVFNWEKSDGTSGRYIWEKDWKGGIEIGSANLWVRHIEHCPEGELLWEGKTAGFTMNTCLSAKDECSTQEGIGTRKRLMNPESLSESLNSYGECEITQPVEIMIEAVDSDVEQNIWGYETKEVLKLKITAKGGRFSIEELHLENDVNEDETSSTLAPVVLFSLAKEGGKQVIGGQYIVSGDGKMHFGKGVDSIYVSDGYPLFLLVTAHLKDEYSSSEIHNFRISLDTNHVTKGIKLKNYATGNTVTTPENGWGDATGSKFWIKPYWMKE